MTTKSDTRAAKATGSCGYCGKSYNLTQRMKEIANYNTPNTADQYCSDGHWVQGTSEITGIAQSGRGRFVMRQSVLASLCNAP